MQHDTPSSDAIRQESLFLEEILNEVSQVVVGQRLLLERLIQALICEGHVLLEGLPGLAKTLVIKTVAQVIGANFQRIQFTPDLLPADLIGTMIFDPRTADFKVRKGPLFTQLVLADEINRAPAKVQSALLEAMGERQVTIGETSFPLDDPFVVLATQNPIEQEGTYTLPEAQLDRFLFKVRVGYPTVAEEKQIMNRMSGAGMPVVRKLCDPSALKRVRELAARVYMDEKVKDYIVNVVFATRFPEQFQLADLKSKIEAGASPRATLALAKASRAHALMRNRSFVTPEDVKAIAPEVLRHRIVLAYEAQAEGIDGDQIVKRVLDRVEVP